MALTADDIQQIARASHKARNVYFCFANGSDSNTGLTPTLAFKSIYKATTLAVAGDVIFFDGPINQSSTNIDIFPDYGGSPNDHRQVIIPAGVRLIGGSRATAIINTDSGPVTAAGANVLMENFTISMTQYANDFFTTPIGYNSTPTKDVTVRNVRTIADTDGAYHISNTGQGTGFWRYYDCLFNSQYDAHTILGTNTDQQVEFYNCWHNVVGPTLINPTNNICRAITGQQGITRCFGGGAYVTTTDETTTTDIEAVYARAGSSRVARIELYDYQIRTKVSSTYTGTNYGINCDAGCTLILSNAVFDRSKVPSSFAGTVSFSDPVYALQRMIQAQLNK